MTDAHARRAADTPVPWDDIRHRRVLTQIEATMHARAGGRRRRGWIGAGVGLAAAVAGVLVFLMLPRAPHEETIPLPAAAATAPIAVAPGPTIPYVAWPRLRLPDDSSAELRHGAQVDVQEHSDHRVQLAQRSGEVRYEVTPDRTRAFVVHAGGVQVRVVGTIFTVTLDEQAHRVVVAVERGRVEVTDGGERVSTLGPGDELGLELTLVEQPDDDDLVLLDPDPTTSRPAVARASIDTLLADADAARAGGDLRRAAAALSELVRRFPRDPRAYSAHFQLGKVERARGRHAAAATAFVRCWKRSPAGALAEDARAESAMSWSAAGRDDRARNAARSYLERYPGGTHRTRMRALVGE